LLAATTVLLLASFAAAFGPVVRIGASAAARPLRAPQPELQGRGQEFSAAARQAARAAKLAEGPRASPQRPAQVSTHLQSAHNFWARERGEAPATAHAHATASATLDAQAQASGDAVLDSDYVVQVLSEFVQSDYARQLYEYASVSPTDYGKIGGMFDHVRLENAKIVVKLKHAFEQRSTQLLDRLKKHLHAKMPQLKVLQYQQGSTTQTIMLR